MRVLAGCLFVCISPPAFAGAWTQPESHAFLALTGSYYRTDELYNNRGDTQSQATYSKYELNPYFEYGLWDGVTLGANVLLQRAHQSSDTNWGLSDTELFVRGRLWQKDGFVLSAEPMVKLPSPESADDQPRLGGSHPDAGMGLSAGYGFTAWGLNHFADIDAQYRHRFGDPKDQARFAGTLGIRLCERFILMPQVFITQRLDTPTTATFTQSSADDYNLVKLQLSGVYKATDDVSVQVGGFTHQAGKNTGAGSGALFSVWKNF